LRREIEERLSEYDRELGNIQAELEYILGKRIVSNRMTPKELALFGLTLDEADAWVQNEPDFKPRGKLTPYRSGECSPFLNTSATGHRSEASPCRSS